MKRYYGLVQHGVPSILAPYDSTVPMAVPRIIEYEDEQVADICGKMNFPFIREEEERMLEILHSYNGLDSYVQDGKFKQNDFRNKDAIFKKADLIEADVPTAVAWKVARTHAGDHNYPIVIIDEQGLFTKRKFNCISVTSELSEGEERKALRQRLAEVPGTVDVMRFLY